MELARLGLAPLQVAGPELGPALGPAPEVGPRIEPALQLEPWPAAPQGLEHNQKLCASQLGAEPAKHCHNRDNGKYSLGSDDYTSDTTPSTPPRYHSPLDYTIRHDPA